MPTPRSPRAKALAQTTQARGRLTRAQASLAELKAAKLRGELLLVVPSRIGARLPHLDAGDIDAIDREVRDALAEIGSDGT